MVCSSLLLPLLLPLLLLLDDVKIYSRKNGWGEKEEELKRAGVVFFSCSLLYFLLSLCFFTHNLYNINDEKNIIYIYEYK